jgi:putative DNA primase/helicase
MPLPIVEAPAPEAVNSTETVKALAKLNPLEYDQQREAASKALGVRTSTLDSEVKRIKGDKASSDSPFDDVELWPTPVSGAQLLDEITATIRRFIVCSPEAANGAALWASMTWFMDVVQIAPIAAITAPEKRCGKSQLLFVLRRLSRRPLAASSISPAALYRSIEAWEPTLLIDEADACMRDNEELRGIINSGHTRDSAYVIRTVGDDHTPKKFSTWGAKAIAGIGAMADTIADRSIALELRRKMPGESVERLRHAETGCFEGLASKLARFADDSKDAVRRARPELPVQLNDRAQDNWEPLLAIADVAGGRWPRVARDAALILSGETDMTLTGGAELLSDIKAVFERLGKDKIGSATLINALCADEEAPWVTFNRGRPISPRQLARRLDAYGIKSKNVRIEFAVTKGFELAQFEDAFLRYLAAPPVPSATALQLNQNQGFLVAANGNVAVTATDDATPKLNQFEGCSGVADLRQVASAVRYEI